MYIVRMVEGPNPMAPYLLVILLRFATVVSSNRFRLLPIRLFFTLEQNQDRLYPA